MKTALISLSLLALASPVAAQTPVVWVADTAKTLTDVSLTDGSLKMVCLRKSGQIRLSYPGLARPDDRFADGRWVDRVGHGSPWPSSVTLTSTTFSSTVRGTTSRLGSDGQPMVNAEIATAAPVIKAFAKTGALVVGSPSGGAQPAIAKPATVRKFLSACG
jgi:hypothetical protein